jgi:hypothetical protein
MKLYNVIRACARDNLAVASCFAVCFVFCVASCCGMLKKKEKKRHFFTCFFFALLYIFLSPFKKFLCLLIFCRILLS